MKIFNESKLSNSLPFYASEDAAGMDLQVKDTIWLKAGERTLAGTGVHVEIPKGFFGMLVPRSSLSKKQVYMTNSVGIIDADYRGEIKVSLIYMPKDSISFDELYGCYLEPGERIVQLVIVPYIKVKVIPVNSRNELEETVRGEGGFGSTGA